MAKAAFSSKLAVRTDRHLSVPERNTGEAMGMLGGAICDRPRVVARIQRALAYRIAVICAPPGYGKTIAVRQFLAHYTSSVLVDLAREQTGIDGVIDAFARALATIAPHADLPLQEAIGRCPGSADRIVRLVRTLTTQLAAMPLLIAVDGLTTAHLDDPAIAALLVRLTERSSEGTRWLLSTRSTGFLPLASWMAYDAMEVPVDSTDLAFTRDEATLAAVAIASATPGSVQFEATFERTAGWPSAFMLALRDSYAPGFGCRPGSHTDLIFAYIAEQVVNGLQPRERDFLLSTCVLPVVDVATIARMGPPDALEIAERLRPRLPLIIIDADGSFTYVPVLRDFLLHRLALRGQPALHAALAAAGKALERLERFAAALDVYTRGGAEDHVERLLTNHGLTLLEGGEVVAVTAGITYLHRLERASTPELLCLRAILEANAGNGSWANSLFESALAATGESHERNRLGILYALELVKRNDVGAPVALRRILPLLEAARSQCAPPAGFNVRLAGTLAVVYTLLERSDEAAARIAEALALVSADEDPGVQALVFHQASYVAYAAGDGQRAARLASTALKLAVDGHNVRLATRSCSIRFSIARGIDDDPDRAFEHLGAMHDFALACGDRGLQGEALAGLLDIEAERGNESGVEELLSRIDACAYGPDLQATAVVPAFALSAAWQGNFRAAHDRIAGSDSDAPTVWRRALRLAEIALYAAACEEREAALAAAAEAIQLVRGAKARHAEDRRRGVRTIALCALTSLTVGNTSTANGYLCELERARREMSVRTRSIVEAVRAIYLRAEIGSEQPLDDALARLETAGHGGFAKLIRALPLVRGSGESLISTLTPTEVDVLRALAGGGSSATVAVALKRSVNTVNVHVKSVMRKLNCRNRYDAIALARDHGIVL